MPFNPSPDKGLDATLISAEWRYFNERMAYAGLDSKELIDDHGIQHCPHGRLWDYGIRSQRTQGRGAILIQHINELGQKTDNYHARMIGGPPTDQIPPKGMSLEKFQKTLKEAYPRYLHARGHIDAYCPRIPASWMDLECLFITEGALKAIKACREGIPTVGILGKDMFLVRDTNLFVPTLERILRSEKLKHITVIGDSDARKNMDIRASYIRFVGLLNGRRPGTDFADFLVLPDLPDLEKTGIDDYLNKLPTKMFWDNISNWIEKWQGGRYQDCMDLLNKMLCWVQDTTNFVNLETRTVIPKSAADLLVGPILSKAGTMVNPYNGAKIPNAKATLNNTFERDPFRNECSGVDYWPGMPAKLEDGKFNLWRDTSPEATEGDVTPFLNLLEYVVPESHQRDCLLKLFAYHIVHPSKKSPLIVFLSGGEGTGKSCIARALFESVCSEVNYFIGGMRLNYAHENAHACKQCVCLEEPSRSGMTYKDTETLFKLWGDNDTISVNPKGVNAYQVRNRCLFWINSNERFVPISGEARRWLCLESPYEANKPLVKACWDWMQSGVPFASYIRHFLVTKYPEVTDYELWEIAGALDFKQELLGDNRHPTLVEYEMFLNHIPSALLDLKCVPINLMNERPPYRDKNKWEYSSIGRELNTIYPRVKLKDGNTQGYVSINGTNTAFRSTVKGKCLTLDIQYLRDVYDKFLKYWLLQKY